MRNWLILLGLVVGGCSASVEQPEYLAGEKITLDFIGPESSEMGELNPFTDVRLDVTFTNKDHQMTIPGFYAADGQAAQSSASAGNTWKVRTRFDQPGTWSYSVSFKLGKGIAVDHTSIGESIGEDGTTGTLEIVQNTTNSWTSKGRLQTNGSRYRQFSRSGEYFLKAGADSPENFLAFADFDDTYRYAENDRSGEARVNSSLHRYGPHLKDWIAGDPTWKNGKGKAIFGALNYLASKNMNVVYMLTMNIEGDGKDVWPYISPDEFTRFDCSKLDQWEIVFDHMDKMGITQHFVLQETENETLLDNGNTGFTRKLYLREMIARFSHHPGVTWNIGEENGPADFSPDGQTTEQQKAMIAYINEVDPFGNLIVVHTHASRQLRHDLMGHLLGDSNLTGLSMQIGSPVEVHEETKYWVQKSKEAGKQWVVNMDEIGPYWAGIHPDNWPQNNQDTVIREALWGHLMAGGAGVEWYFGYKAPHNDLSCEDWRSRDRVWTLSNHAISFFRNNLPFNEMESRDDLLEESDAFVFAKENEIYAVYIPQSRKVSLRLGDGIYRLSWYDPFLGGDLMEEEERYSKRVSLIPPNADQDWVCLITRL